jgi:hypothetical protein
MSSIEDYMLPCLNKKLFGFDCLGCGLQRSLVLIYHGEFAAAFYMYPAIYLLIPLFILILLNLFLKKRRLNKLINVLAILSITIIIISFTIKIIN